MLEVFLINSAGRGMKKHGIMEIRPLAQLVTLYEDGNRYIEDNFDD